MCEGDILVYADSGCTIFKSKEWNNYFKYLEEYSIVAFMINATVEEHTKKSVIDHFKAIGNHWQKRLQIAATFFVLKKTEATTNMMNEWREIMVTRPDLVIDVHQNDYKNESVKFKENRHDQSIFTALCYKYQKNCKIKILYNHFEGGKDRLKKQAIVASRISDEEVRGGRSSIIKSLLFHIAAKPYRLIYQRYWTLRK